ncbi:uncharacterized protein DUF4270 [Winogradskyella wandonensis]|uniref:Uncharacterized protein DUF4270 n=1 Tax=Winogradskyella wandonensis TaxID=1442586 RepID=A0A4R1KRJ8_9FLAO|nr:DUF4270 domain-containing protein [Winogradskyella wandonensis]TCK67644.1 uncharacterized protein DUF4270 [Winogradskyella wandonensis]
MKLNKIALRYFAIATIIGFGFIACDDEFTTIESDIINSDTATSFNTISEKFEVISYTNKLGPVQTNDLGLATLGIYIDPIFGRTTSSFLTQINSPENNPSFGNNPELDSVVLTIPYFATNLGISTAGNNLYDLDSILPKKPNNDYPAIRLRIYESDFYLRDFNPAGDFEEAQNYFSNKSLSSSETISESLLKSRLLHTENELNISNQEIRLLDNDGEITQTIGPAIRIVLDNAFWEEKILNQVGEPVLDNPNNFRNYFRGLYFEAEDNIGDSSLMLLDLSQSNANITMHYSRDPFTEGLDRVQTTYTFTFGPTRINFFDNDFSIPDGDTVNGDERISLKGGEGSVATIKLFDGENPDDNDNVDNSFEAWRKEYVNLNDEGEFESPRRLINEAHLVFYVDESTNFNEIPERLYLYDKTNGQPLIDYFEDEQNNSLPEISIPNHLGIIERDNDGHLRYKMRITSHLRNLLFNNSENVELGLSVSGNVNLEGFIPQYQVQSAENQENTVPVSSLITPRGVILHGSDSNDISKRIILEIFYTCLDTDNNCPNE